MTFKDQPKANIAASGGSGGDSGPDTPRAIGLSLAVARALVCSYVLLASACSTGAPSLRGGSGFTPLAAEEIQQLQNRVNIMSQGERIAFWAEQFLNAPYDTDPLGEYVRSGKVICDFRVDCMYLVFRAVELAQANTPQGATDRALDLRFRTRGRIWFGRVANYDERFDYAEDMVASGRWGRDLSAELGPVAEIPGTRGYRVLSFLRKEELLKQETLGKLKSGDLVFFVKDPAERPAGEMIGHLGIVKVEQGTAWLIHASGLKAPGDKAGGMVKKVSIADYFAAMKFIGAKVTRFE